MSMDLDAYIANMDSDSDTEGSPKPLPISFPFDKIKGREILKQIIALQGVDGSFKLDDNLVNVLGLDLSDLKLECERSGFNKDAFATVLVMVYFVRRLGPLEKEWLRHLKKCNAWLFETFGGQDVNIPNQQLMFMAALYTYIPK